MRKKESAVRLIRLLQKNRICQVQIRGDQVLNGKRMSAYIRLSAICLVSDMVQMEKEEVWEQMEIDRQYP